MRSPSYSGQFKRDVNKAKKRGKDMQKLKTLMQILIDEKTLPAKYSDHSLKGNWHSYRDAHIEPDWLLIYKIEGNNIHFERTGSHADLFR